MAVGGGQRAVAAGSGAVSSGRRPGIAASPSAARGAQSACGSPEDRGCPSIPRYTPRQIYTHSCQIYWLRLPYDLNVDFCCFMRMYAFKWLDYDLILCLARFICYGGGLVILEILCGFGRIYGPSGLNA